MDKILIGIIVAVASSYFTLLLSNHKRKSEWWWDKKAAAYDGLLSSIELCLLKCDEITTKIDNGILVSEQELDEYYQLKLKVRYLDNSYGLYVNSDISEKSVTAIRSLSLSKELMASIKYEKEHDAIAGIGAVVQDYAIKELSPRTSIFK